MFKKAINYLCDLFQRSYQDAAQPYVPHPPGQESEILSNKPTSGYQEVSDDLEIVGGTSISFGTEESIVIDDDGNAVNRRRTMSHVLGSGLLVTSLRPTIENGVHLPGVHGECHYCKQEALFLLQRGLIPIEEAERRSLCDTDSAAKCEGCRRLDLCVNHCLPFGPEGNQKNYCPDCTKVAEQKEALNTSLHFILYPILDHKRLPPGELGEDDHV
ncbi:hypothetical protein ACFL5Z_17950 [Planctomycetota bacterium]